MIKLEKDHSIRVLYLGNVHFSGTITCETGLHIGDSDDSIKIGGIDKFVIKDPITNEPYIPGSSLKGKQRAMLERSLGLIPNRESDNVWRYEVDDINDAITDRICRIFGSSSTSKSKMNFPSRLIVRDCFVNGRYKYEKKSENVIDRISGQAVPRTNERVAKDTKFNIDMDYNVEVIVNGDNTILLGNNTTSNYWDIVIEDLHTILDTFSLIEMTYLGGNGSRGYGKVFFEPYLEACTKNELIGIKNNIEQTISNDLKDQIVEYYIEDENDTYFYSQRKEIINFVKKFKHFFETIANT